MKTWGVKSKRATYRTRVGFAKAYSRKLSRQIKGCSSSVCLAAALLLVASAPLFRPLHVGAVPPATPPSQICGDSTVLDGPSSAPAGAVTVPAGNNSAVFSGTLPPSTIYWFAAGTHKLASSTFAQIAVSQGDTFIGAPGAILDGQNLNQFSFIGNSASDTGVTIEHLTIQKFAPPGSQGAVNQNSNSNWTIKYNTIQDNLPGAAMMIGSNNDIEYNCLTQNGEYAFNAYENPADATVSALTGGPHDITISNNEISKNNTCNWETVSNFPITQPLGCSGAGQFNGCGCSGGGKFWAIDQATYDNNYVHDNYSVGMWADTNNTGFDVEGNYFANNYGEGILYEISYNALFKDNTFVSNAVLGGPENPGFPDSAIYISESGGDARVPGFSSGSLQITDNALSDNWGGVVLWENADRYCSSVANTSTGYCTLVNPSVANLTTCSNNTDLAMTPYIDDCRWKTQNISVDHNTFNFSSTAIGSNCTTGNGCGYNALFSNYGTVAIPYSAWVVPENISNHQSNTFSHNTYRGPWNFMGFNQGDTMDWSGWSGGFDDGNGSGDHFNAQDASSTFTSSALVPPSTPSNVAAAANSSTSVAVSWDASLDSNGPGLGGYHILRGGVQIATVGPSITSYLDTTAVASTQYSYTVTAFDTSIPVTVSAQSSPAVVTTPAASNTSGGGSSGGTSQGSTTGSSSGTTAAKTSVATSGTAAQSGVGGSQAATTAPVTSAQSSSNPQDQSTSSSLTKTVTITVVDSSGKPVKDAKVSIDGYYTTYTNSGGVAGFSELPSGKHMLTVTAGGKPTVSRSVTFAAGKDSHVSVTLGNARSFVPLVVYGVVGLVAVAGAVFTGVRLRGPWYEA